jgi:hypothetical protein
MRLVPGVPRHVGIVPVTLLIAAVPRMGEATAAACVKWAVTVKVAAEGLVAVKFPL